MMPLRRLSNLPIRYRVVAVLVFIVLAAEITTAYLIFNQYKTSMIAQSMQHLADIRDNRIYGIRTNLQNILVQSELFSSMPGIIEDLSHDHSDLNNAGAIRQFDEAVAGPMRYVKETSGLHNIFIISKHGDIIHSAAIDHDLGTALLTGPLRDSALATVFRQSTQLLQPQISSIGYYEPSGEASLFIATPVIKNTQLLGATAVQLNWEGLADILKSISGLGKTGEVVAGIQRDGHAHIAPLRNVSSNGFDLKIQVGLNLAGPVQMALKGNIGSGFSADYRNIDVVAAWGYIPELEMGIVVKMDTAELLEPVTRMQRITVLLVAVIMLTTGLIGYLLARTITAPLVQLTASTRRYADGDLTARSNISSTDETGQLAASFNAMAEHISEYTQEIRNKSLALEKAGAVLEQKVDERTVTLAAANEEIKSFAYIVSHDLRSPLVNMKGFTGELAFTLNDISELVSHIEEKLGDGDLQTMHRLIQEEIPESMSFINTSVEKMDHMLTAILTLSRLGRRVLVPEQVDLKVLCDEILASLAHQIKQTNTTVELGNLPVINNDRIVLEQIMGNLIGNAIKYLDPNRPGKLSIQSETADNGITISVTDNGRGIDADEKEKVFQIFRRGKHQDVEGEGMGLAYVQTLVRAQNGSISFKSEANTGSTFTVFLPIKPEPDRQQEE